MTTHFAVTAWDAPNSASKRTSAMADHFAHIEAIMDSIAIAGPLKNAEGVNIGSLLVFKAGSLADAEALFRADPYFKAGVWDRFEINSFNPAAGEWVGGKTW